jgi:outer membrane receptor for ferric coprogen and ferric-rhodotorulic acid
MKSKIAFLLGGVSVLVAAPAAAQEAEGDSANDEIVVVGSYTLPNAIDTATGLGLTVQETPQSVSIMTAQRILDQNLISVKDVIQNAVGVAINETDDVRNSFYARGFQITNTQLDGVPTAWALGGDSGETLADVSLYDRVEIVRGATGLLSGAGDPSASVNLVRKHADRTELTGYVNGSYGSWDTWRVSGDVGGAVVADGSLRFRAVGRYEEGGSQIDGYHNQKLVLYGTIDADITKDTLLRIGFSHQEGNPDGAAWGALPSFYSDGSFARWKRSKSTAANWTHWNSSNQNFFATLRHEFGNGWSAQANYNRLRNTQNTNLLYLYGLVDRQTGLGLASNPYHAEGVSIQNSYDGQIKGRVSLFGRDHEIVVGGLRSIIRRHADTFASLNVLPDGSWPAAGDFNNWTEDSYAYPGFADVATPNSGSQEKITQTGYYGVVRANLSDRLKVIGGGRLASWQQRGFAYGVTNNYGDDNVFIPYVGALYDLTPNHHLYASYTKIFQPQNNIDRNLRQLDPLDGKAYEIGLKSAFFGEALQTSVALFRIEQDNLAVLDGAPIPNPIDPTQAPFQPYVAADGVVSKGFEVEVTGQPLEGWNINFGYSQFKMDANYDQPRRLLKLFTTYTLGDLTFGGGVNYRSKAYTDGANPVTGGDFRFQQDGYALVSLMARYNLTDNLQIQANVENLLDKTYFSQIGFFSQYRYGEPRNVTVAANYRF